MVLRSILGLAVVAGLGLGQTPDALTNQKIIQELKGLRASLERIEKGQEALALLLRIQIAEGRAASLEAEGRRLRASEDSLRDELARATQAEEEKSGKSPTGEAVGAPAAATNRAGVSGIASRLQETLAARRTIEQSIRSARAQIEAWEKQLAAPAQ